MKISTKHVFPAIPWVALLASTSILNAAFTIAAAPGLTYVKPTTAGVQTVHIIGTATQQFAIDPTTVPVWLTVSPLNGLAALTPGTPVTLTPNALCGSLASGLYSGSLKVTDIAAATSQLVPITLLISDPAVTVTGTFSPSVTSATASVGGSIPSFTLTLVSSGGPASFSIPAPTQTYVEGSGTGNVTLAESTTWMRINSVRSVSGVAYSWGTALTFTIDPTAWAQSAVTGVFATSVVINYGSAGTITIPFSVTVAPPTPTITGFTPAILPPVIAADATFVINGRNFVTGPSGSVSTISLVTVAGTPVTLALSMDYTMSVLSPDAILVKILHASNNVNTTAFAATPAATGLTVQVTNPATSAVVGGAIVLPVNLTPSISAITSASSFLQTAGSPTIAPYDVISIFGQNLCVDCTASTATVVAALTFTASPIAAVRYPLGLTGDTSAHNVQVLFVKHSDHTTVLGQGHLLFTTNNQMNVLVPSGVSAVLGTTTATSGTGNVDVYVNYVTGAIPAIAATTFTAGAGSSAAFNVIAAAFNPGIFALDATGQGQGAILNSDGTLNGIALSNGTGAAKGSVISIYMTGLGIPDSVATDATTTVAAAYPGSCLAGVATLNTPGTAALAPISYLAAVNTVLTSATTAVPPVTLFAAQANYTSPAWTNLDGALIQSAFVPDVAHHFAPCLKTAPTVTIGGKAATVLYAGWLMDSVTGLYQINVTIPAATTGLTTGVQPVVVTVGATPGTVSSQSGITVNVL